MNHNVMEFLYFHYMTQRSDSDFWTRFTQDNQMPHQLRDRLELMSSLDFTDELANSPAFGKQGYLAVGAGTGFFNRQQAEMRFQSMMHGEGQRLYQRALQDYLRNIDLNSHTALDHRWFLNYVMTGRINN